MQTSDVICFFIFVFLWANKPVVKNKVGGPKYVHRVQRKSNFIRHRLKPKDGGEEISDGAAFLLVGNVQERKKHSWSLVRKAAVRVWVASPPSALQISKDIIAIVHNCERNALLLWLKWIFLIFFFTVQICWWFVFLWWRKKKKGGHKGKNKEMWAGWSSDRAKAERLVSGKELVRKELISCVCTRMETS